MYFFIDYVFFLLAPYQFTSTKLVIRGLMVTSIALKFLLVNQYMY